MKFTYKFTAYQFNMSAYRLRLSKHMSEWVKQAARDWLLATVITVIPTWSKASRATFQKLAREVGMAIPYGPQESRKDREALGRSTSTDSGLRIKPSELRWHFRYHSTLRYLAYNEYNRVVYGQAPNVFSKKGLKNPTPYNFQDKGREAFEQFTRFTELPNPYDFLKKKKVA